MTGYLQRDHRAAGKVCLGFSSSVVVPSKGSLSLNVNHPSPVRRKGGQGVGRAKEGRRREGGGGGSYNSLPRCLRGPADGADSSWKAHYRCERVWLPAARSPSDRHQSSCRLQASPVAALAHSGRSFSSIIFVFDPLSECTGMHFQTVSLGSTRQPDFKKDCRGCQSWEF